PRGGDRPRGRAPFRARRENGRALAVLLASVAKRPIVPLLADVIGIQPVCGSARSLSPGPCRRSCSGARRACCNRSSMRPAWLATALLAAVGCKGKAELKTSAEVDLAVEPGAEEEPAPTWDAPTGGERAARAIEAPAHWQGP